MTDREDSDDEGFDIDVPEPPEFDPRTVPMSWTVLSQMPKSPAHVRYAASRGRTDEGTLAMKMGRGFHAVALGQPFAVYTETKQRRGKVWDAWKADHDRLLPGAPVLSMREYRQAQDMSDALHANRDAERLVFGPGVAREDRIVWSKDDRAMVSHVDFRKRGEWLGDLKMVKSAALERWRRSADASYPHVQVCLYDEADRFDTGRPDDHEIPLYIVAVEGAPPYPVVVWNVHASARREARRTLALWWNRLRICEESNQWPGYTQSIEQFTSDFDEDNPSVADADDDDDTALAG